MARKKPPDLPGFDKFEGGASGRRPFSLLVDSYHPPFFQKPTRPWGRVEKFDLNFSGQGLNLFSCPSLLQKPSPLEGEG